MYCTFMCLYRMLCTQEVSKRCINLPLYQQLLFVLFLQQCADHLCYCCTSVCTVVVNLWYTCYRTKQAFKFFFIFRSSVFFVLT